MTIEAFIQQYGYAAVLVGTFLEGETVLVIGGFAAHRGYLDFPWVLMAAFTGSLLGDQLYFLLGRRYSNAILRRRPAWAPRIARAGQLIGRHRTLVILAFRFIYGLRTVIPFALGMSSVPFRQFLFLNLVGALAWSVVVGTAGYLFGHVLELLLEDVRRYEMAIIALLALIGALVWLIRAIRGRHSGRLGR
jgi:membrane protein DedA with SNARE-associated domain